MEQVHLLREQEAAEQDAREEADAQVAHAKQDTDSTFNMARKQTTSHCPEKGTTASGPTNCCSQQYVTLPLQPRLHPNPSQPLPLPLCYVRPAPLAVVPSRAYRLLC